MRILTHQLNDSPGAATLTPQVRKTLKRKDVLAIVKCNPSVLRRLDDENRLSPVESSSKQRMYSAENVFEALAAIDTAGHQKSPETQPVIVSVMSSKGGVGKTTMTDEIGMQLAIKHKKVLFIDLDNEGNLSYMLGYNPELTVDDAIHFGLPRDLCVEHNISSLFLRGEKMFLKDVVKMPYGKFGPHLLPCDSVIVDFESQLTARDRHSKYDPNLMKADLSFKTWMETHGQALGLYEYDFIFFDCPGSASSLVRNALLCSDIVLSPVQMDVLAIKGTDTLVNQLLNQQEAYGHTPSLVFVPTFYDPNNAITEYCLSSLFQRYPKLISVQAVRQTDQMKASLINMGLPLSLSDPESPVVLEDFLPIANDLLDLAQRNRR